MDNHELTMDNIVDILIGEETSNFFRRTLLVTLTFSNEKKE